MFYKYSIIVFTILTTILQSYVIISYSQYEVIEPVSFIERQKHLLEVFPNHNNPNSDRINLIFVINSQDSNYRSYIKSILPDLLGWNGIKLSKDYGENLTLNIGLFATDPIRNYKDKFNIYLLDDIYKINQINDRSFGLSKEVRINIYKSVESDPQDSGSYEIKDISIVSKAKFEDQIRLGINTDEFIKTTQSWSNILTHELGHNIFNLADEYKKSIKLSASTTNGEDIQKDARLSKELIKKTYNCANNLEEAQSKWGQYIGQVDPEFYYLKSQYQKIDSKAFKFEVLEDRYRIKSTPHYCNSEISDARDESSEPNFKPSETSLMDYTGLPIWGSYNRKQVETILNAIPGTGKPIESIRTDFTQDEINLVRSQSYTQLEIEQRRRLGLEVIRPSTIDIPKDNNSILDQISMLLLSNANWIFIIISILSLIIIHFFFKKKLNNKNN
jgi:hypothetical protein